MIVTFGSLNTDLIFEVEAFPVAGQTIRSRSLRMEAGGKGANQAVAAARDGASVVMVGAVGQDPLAKIALKHLADSNVDITRVKAVAAPTGCASVYVDTSGRNEIVVASGANDYASGEQLDPGLLARANTLLMQMECGASQVEILLQQARDVGLRSILNLAPAVQLDLQALRLCDILVVNEDEAVVVSDWFGCAPDAGSISKFAGISVLRTLGARGAEIDGPIGRCSVSGIPIVPIDTTAAGDCFIGVFAAGLDAGLDLHTSMTRATAAAALSCQRKGSQISLPWKGETDAFLADNLPVEAAGACCTFASVPGFLRRPVGLLERPSLSTRSGMSK